VTVAAAGERIDGIDFIKAAAIVAVVATHSGFAAFYPNATVWDRAFNATWTWFHGPSFLLVSGFLYCRESPVGPGDIARRLLRVWIPYVIASVFMQVSGTTPVDGPGQALHQIVTASAIPVYYYIALLSGCTLAVWPLSRLAHRGAAVLLAALFAYAVALVFAPGLHVPSSPFWMARNPLETFALGYFVLGWVAAQHRDALARCLERRRALIGGVAAAGAAFWFVSMGRIHDPDAANLNRISYTLSVVALILVATHGRRAGRGVRFLSTTTLAIYLYHVAPIVAVNARIVPWPPPLRIGLQFVIGLGFGSLVAIVGRRVLGAARARRYLGA
jgi:fucose 4-O-acetylase-like acetyltransferase